MMRLITRAEVAVGGFPVSELMQLFEDKEKQVRVRITQDVLGKSHLSEEEFGGALKANLDVWIKAYMQNNIAVFEFYV